MLYFTSDLHLGHENAIGFTNRPFVDVEEMDRKLIENINETVLPEDELWILGDFSFKIDRARVRELRKQIACRMVHLVYGNHDKDYANDHIFQSVQHYKELKSDYGRLVLFHYPILEWSAAHYGSVHLHGHIHSTGAYNEANRLKKLRDRGLVTHEPKHEDLGLRIYDVGVDANGYRPVSIEQIAAFLSLPPVRGPLLNAPDGVDAMERDLPDC